MLGRGRNYKDKGTVERREGMVNTQQGGKGGANKGPSDSFMSWQFFTIRSYIKPAATEK